MNKTLKEMHLTFHNVMTVMTHLYQSERILDTDEKRTQATGII